jgi:hypothetical protein
MAPPRRPPTAEARRGRPPETRDRRARARPGSLPGCGQAVSVAVAPRRTSGSGAGPTPSVTDRRTPRPFPNGPLTSTMRPTRTGPGRGRHDRRRSCTACGHRCGTSASGHPQPGGRRGTRRAGPGRHTAPGGRDAGRAATGSTAWGGRRHGRCHAGPGDGLGPDPRAAGHEPVPAAERDAEPDPAAGPGRGHRRAGRAQRVHPDRARVPHAPGARRGAVRAVRPRHPRRRPAGGRPRRAAGRRARRSRPAGRGRRPRRSGPRRTGPPRPRRRRAQRLRRPDRRPDRSVGPRGERAWRGRPTPRCGSCDRSTGRPAGGPTGAPPRTGADHLGPRGPGRSTRPGPGGTGWRPTTAGRPTSCPSTWTCPRRGPRAARARVRRPAGDRRPDGGDRRRRRRTRG